jgi:hypothetical protein
MISFWRGTKRREKIALKPGLQTFETPGQVLLTLVVGRDGEGESIARMRKVEW